MPDPPFSSQPLFLCDGAKLVDGPAACVKAPSYREPFYKEYEGRRYCALHFPSKDKVVDFWEAFHRKVENKDFNFRGVWFPDKVRFFRDFDLDVAADFSFATFSDEANFQSGIFRERVDFLEAVFMGEADFSKATFCGDATFMGAEFQNTAHFIRTTFSLEANFNRAKFRAGGAYFSVASFGPTDFRLASFDTDVYFRDATFSAQVDLSATFQAQANFRSASFAKDVRFAGDQSQTIFTDTSCLDLQFAKIESPDHFSFDTLRLRPHWFVNVDTRGLNFIDVDWQWQSTAEELAGLQNYEVSSSAHRVLSIACQRLATNAENNNRYEEASKFRYLAMDARRRERWHGFAFWRLSWWYWLASGYGERAWQALIVLLGIWLLSALFYSHVGFVRWEPRLASETDMATARRDVVGAPLRWDRSLTYSAGVMTLQKPEPRPATTSAQTVVFLETILGPIQAALLALAIRRKFMR